MKSVPITMVLPVCLMLAACAGTTDHFYTLNTAPDAAPPQRPAPTTPVRLSVSVPSLVDRSEMVLSTSTSGVLILDHERWATPLSDQVVQTLARDIERRRPDLLIGDRRFDQSASTPVSLRVDIIRMSAQRGGGAGIEAHWRIVDAASGTDRLGSGAFEAAGNGDGYAVVAQAYSRLLGDLADRLAAEIGRR